MVVNGGIWSIKFCPAAAVKPKALRVSEVC